MASHKKVTWEMIYKDFRSRFPNLKNEVEYWKPHSYSTIELHIKDGRRLIYNYDEKIAKIISAGKE